MVKTSLILVHVVFHVKREQYEKGNIAVRHLYSSHEAIANRHGLIYEHMSSGESICETTSEMRMSLACGFAIQKNDQCSFH